MTTDERIVLRALELALDLAEERLLGAPDWAEKSAEADVRDIKYAIRLVKAWDE